MTKVLIVEDDPSLVIALQRGFELEGYEAELVTDGEAALSAASDKSFDMLILDVMLPKKSGFDVCQQLRQAGNYLPIIMLTARGQEVDKIVGLKLGADDYVTKPFSIMELIARVEALLRRVNREFRLLKYFIEHRGEVVTRDQLLDAVWDYDHFPLSRTVDMHIAKLRQKIEPTPNNPTWLVTVHGSGYRFNEQGG